MKQRLFILILVLALILGTAAPAFAVQYSPPWADNFGTNYEPWAAGDTTYCAQVATYYQDLIGYNADYWSGTYNRYEYAMELMPYDAVFSFFGHGAPGVIWFYDGSEPTYIIAMDLYGITNLYDIKFAAYMGCQTARTEYLIGNLLTVSREQGIDSAMGFYNSIAVGPHNTFASTFWYNGYLGNSVGVSAYYAKEKVKQIYGGYYGYDSYVFDGAYTWPKEVKIKPAGYGN